MNITDYVVLSFILLGALYLLYRTFFKKDKCAKCSEGDTCVTVNPKKLKKSFKQ